MCDIGVRGRELSAGGMLEEAPLASAPPDGELADVPLEELELAKWTRAELLVAEGDCADED